MSLQYISTAATGHWTPVAQQASITTDTLLGSLQTMWYSVAAVLPQVFFAIFFIIFGFLIGWLFKHVIEEIFKTLKIDTFLEHSGVDEFLAKAGYKLNSGKFIGEIGRWFFIVVFAIFAFDMLHLDAINMFLSTIATDFIPNLAIAAVILFAGSILAEFLAKLAKASFKFVQHGTRSHMIGTVVRWAVWIFTIILVLDQLGIAQTYLQAIFIAVIAMVALAGGLAFGLGGRDAAARFIEETSHNLKEDEHHPTK
ncbi:hypothetical protein H6776_01715 [Candidatus Nomurabacteria bacterium]|nr:hypothetical protein [Candidatus Nomurabacteria bacterium]